MAVSAAAFLIANDAGDVLAALLADAKAFRAPTTHH
jgi:hypothetical protein